MYKTMGGGYWTGLWSDLNVVEQEPVRLELMPKPEIKIEKHFSEDEEGLQEISNKFSLAWHSLKHVSFHEFFS